MPTYGYRCEQCGQEFDVWQRMSDEAKADCPKCVGKGKRLFFPAGIVFKGGGFYKTDSRKSSSSGDGAAAPSKSKDTSTPPSTPSTSSTAATAAD